MDPNQMKDGILCSALFFHRQSCIHGFQNQGCGAAGASPEQAMEMFQGLGELGMFPWRGEGSRESSEPLAGPEGAPGELERDWRQGMEGQDTGNSFALPEGRDGWDFGKELFPLRVVRSWDGIPREAVAAPASLEVSKARLDRAGITLG
ncbi:hypothetical protein HGM15179_017530 [Zosterops borbonicus]|uniref:Uncharacterized protein n=1 Tax=Zosterops borbonicus TaxID=364589 RepID=A0A8K1G0P0_9PASS|nr:hypothetical protein HGM15179_017530 [Zosterops borbonicus]